MRVRTVGKLKLLVAASILGCMAIPLHSQELTSQQASACVDSDGDGYGWNGFETCFPDSSVSQNLIGFTNLATGQRASVNSAYWEKEDFENAFLSCSWYVFDGTNYNEVDWLGSGGILQHGPTDEYGQLDSNSGPFIGTYSVVEGVYNGYRPLALSKWVEVVEHIREDNTSTRASRFWHLDTHYMQCHSINSNRSFSPGGSPDSNNSVSAVTDNCDYSDSLLHNGWGWDPVAQVSCRPHSSESVVEDVDEEELCIDSDGDGWGWDGHESCLIDDASSASISAAIDNPIPGTPITTLLSYTNPVDYIPPSRGLPDTVSQVLDSPSVYVGDLLGQTTRSQAFDSYSRVVSSNEEFSAVSIDDEPARFCFYR